MNFKRLLKVFVICFLFQLSAGYAYSQEIEIKGQVTEAKTGLVLPGVSVIVKGTSVGVITDFDGKYTIKVPNENTVLQFSFVGFLTSERTVGDLREINIGLKEESVKIDEVVVVGYGSQRKESLTAAISTIESEELVKTPTSNLTQSITGKIAGVITNQMSGEPGYDEAEIYIRGRATFTGASSPLVLVDGVERPFSRIDPHDIESISVLKDASATAVYGVRGANGVILITTKRGKEGKPVVTLNVSSGVQAPTRIPKYLNSYESVQLLEEALANDGLPSRYSSDDIEMYRKSVNGELSEEEAKFYPNIDWYDEMLRSVAPEQQVSLNISGGTKRMRYFTSGTYYDQQGLYKNTNDYDFGNSANVRFRRFSFRANIDFDATKDLTLSVNFGTRFEVRNGPSMSQGDLFYELNRTPGWAFPIEWEEGMYGGNAFAKRNIKAWLHYGGFAIDNQVINENSFKAKHKLDFITPGLSIQGMAAFDNTFLYKRIFTRNFATYEYVEANNSFIQYGEPSVLDLTNETGENKKTYNVEGSLNYEREFGNHGVTALVLYKQNNFTFMNRIPFLYQELIGRGTYAFKKRYFTEFNFGYNGSENFAEGNRFGFFPSASAAWLVSEEDFMKNQAFINKLKLRGSYGVVGNDKTSAFILNSDRFLYVTTWHQGGGYIFGTNYLEGREEGILANENVTWEKAEKFNFAIESSMFAEKLGINLDLFYEKRNSILTYPMSIPAVLAVDLPKDNLGRTKNRGFELEIHHKEKLGTNLKLNTTFIWCLAKNEVIFRDEPVGKPEYLKTEGRPIDQYFGLVVDKYFESEEEIANSPVQLFGPVSVGDFKYVDQNGDNMIDSRDIAPVGFSNIPEHTLSMNLSVQYKGLEVSALLQGALNVSKAYDAYAILEFLNGGKVMEHHKDRWDPAQTSEYNMANAEYPLLHFNKGQNNQQLNSFFIKNGNYLRLRSAEIAYSLQKPLLDKLKMQGVRFFLSGSNILTWDHIKIRDPENSGNGNQYPVMSFYNLGVNVQF